MEQGRLKLGPSLLDTHVYQFTAEKTLEKEEGPWPDSLFQAELRNGTLTPKHYRADR